MRVSKVYLLLAAVLLVGVISASVGAAPLFTKNEKIPADATVLFDGKDLSQWVKCGTDQPATWKIKDGYAETQDADICTKAQFGDCQLHVEFWLPLMADKTGESRANSGVFFKGFTYEIQVLDSYGRDKFGAGDCGAIYSLVPPLVIANRPPETWQKYDIIFHQPKWDAAGKKIANARVTVLLNGVLVQDNTDITAVTPNHGAAEPKGPGPIELQFHHCPIRYRNVWVRPL